MWTVPANFSARHPRTAVVFLCLAGFRASCRATAALKFNMSESFWRASCREKMTWDRCTKSASEWIQNFKKQQSSESNQCLFCLEDLNTPLRMVTLARDAKKNCILTQRWRMIRKSHKSELKKAIIKPNSIKEPRNKRTVTRKQKMSTYWTVIVLKSWLLCKRINKLLKS